MRVVRFPRARAKAPPKRVRRGASKVARLLRQAGRSASVSLRVRQRTADQSPGGQKSAHETHPRTRALHLPRPWPPVHQPLCRAGRHWRRHQLERQLRHQLIRDFKSVFQDQADEYRAWAAQCHAMAARAKSDEEEPVARACRKVAAAGCAGAPIPPLLSKSNSPSARKIQTGTLTDSVRNILGTKWGHLARCGALAQDEDAGGGSQLPLLAIPSKLTPPGNRRGFS